MTARPLDIQSPEILKSILDGLELGVYVVDTDRRILLWNAGAERITGFKAHEVMGRPCSESVMVHCQEHGCDLCGSACPLAQVMHEGKPKHAKVYFRHRDGHRLIVNVWAVPIRNEHGTLLGVAESFEGITDESSDGELTPASKHVHLDEASGLADRTSSEFVLNETLARYSLRGLPFGVISIRLNEYAKVLATHGREAAKALLKLAAETITEAIPASSFIGRWKEDEFVVVALNSDEARTAELAGSVTSVTEGIELKWWGDQTPITLSFGTSVVQARDTVDSLLQRAVPASPPAIHVKAAAR